MAETFRERAEKPQERVLPSIAREQRELHSPLDSLSRSAVHLRLPAESARRGGSAVRKSDLDMRVARNAHELRLEGSEPIAQRFSRLLEAV